MSPVSNLFDGIPSELPHEWFDVLAADGTVTIERIASRGHASPEAGWYDQDQDEWVLVVRGSALLVFDDGERLEMGPGDWVDIPAHRRHRVERTDPTETTVWLAVHRAPPSPPDPNPGLP